MKIVLSKKQIEEAVRLYATIISGYDLKDSELGFKDNYNNSITFSEAHVLFKKEPSIPAPSKGKKEITQAEVDQVYSALVNRKLEIDDKY